MFDQRDQRTSYRLPVRTNLEALLTVKRRKATVRVLDESAGGFAVKTADEFSLPRMAIGALDLDSEIYPVQVMYVQAEDGGCRIGLKRLDVEYPAAPTVPKSPHTNSFSWGKLFTFAFFTLFGAALATGVAWLWQRPGANREQLPAIDVVGLSPLTPEAASLMEGANSLRDPAVLESLRINHAQRNEIESLYKQTTLQLRQRYAQALRHRDGQQWQREATQVMENTVKRLLMTLTDDQINQWRKLLTKKDEPTGA